MLMPFNLEILLALAFIVYIIIYFILFSYCNLGILQWFLPLSFLPLSLSAPSYMKSDFLSIWQEYGCPSFWFPDSTALFLLVFIKH